jgi:hypothetical protein
LVALSSLRAQDTAEGSSDPAAPQKHYFEVQAALDTWKAEHGSSWSLVYEKQTGAGRFLYGGAFAASFVPRTDADYFTLARRALDQTFAIHRIDASTLLDDEVMFLPLGNAGSTDKMTVQFRQVVAGVPVIHGFANVLFDLHGTLLSVDSTALPELAGFSVSPSITGERAMRIAVDLFARDAGLEPTFISRPELAIDQLVQGKFRNPALVWRVNVQSESADVQAQGYEYRIDARTGALSSRESSIHFIDVSGTVTSFTSPNDSPDVASNPPQTAPMPNMRVTSASGNATTDINGNFNIVGASAPLNVTAAYIGPWATVVNTGGSAYTLSPSLASGSGNAIVMNSPAAGLVTAQANAFLWTNLQREWTRSVNPADGTHDFLATANVNIASTCNAYYNGTSTNFFTPGAGCPNTAYSSIVLHETGHWMNDRYGSGNGGDGFGEGNADTFSTYLLDDPVIGIDFFGPGTMIRTGLNTRQFCGDSNPGCYGEVHNDGEVLLGALWKVRMRLKAALGNGPGIVTANTLFNAWMNAYNDTQIKSIIETHWLTLDDNDANIGNGTPHHANIDGGFRDQGFPGHTLTFVTISNVTQLTDTQNEIGPYVINADINATLYPPLTAATLEYRLDNGAFTSLPMTFVSGTTYTASIPGQSCTTDIAYYVSATDSSSNTLTFPNGAPNLNIGFTVGNISAMYTADFESGTAGWTHAPVSGSDDWQLSSNYGLTISGGHGGDPTTPAVSGSNIWGNDLGSGFADGLYTSNSSNYLRSPVIDCSVGTHSRLRFKRWLRVEASQFDQATIKVNGNVVWTNPFSADLLDAAWTPIEIDISQYADANPNVRIDFTLTSDGALQYGGWNIDDVQVVAAGSCGPACPPPVTYCTPKYTSQLSVPIIGSLGVPTVTGNNFSVTLANSLPNKQAICFWGTTASSSPFLGGFLCVHSPVQRLPATQTNANAAASVSIPVDASMIGAQRRYQWWFRDPQDPFTVGLSGGLLVNFCQ